MARNFDSSPPWPGANSHPGQRPRVPLRAAECRRQQVAPASGFTLALFFLLSTVCCPLASAQYSIDWFTVDGGGGASTGGVYVLTGTIGQPDAGRMSGGQFTLEGGFWPAITLVQTEGAPMLSIILTNGTAMVSWPQPASGWLLNQATTVNSTPAAWSLVPTNSYQSHGGSWRYSVPSPTDARFFRLHKP